VKELIKVLLTAYLVILAGRAILSWFPVRSGTFMAGVNSLLYDLTEPVLRPVRRLLPATGMLDLSFLVVFVAITILLQAI